MSAATETQDYYWSDSGEGFSFGPFSSREEAVAAATAELEPGDTFWTGVRRNVLDRLSVDADALLERLADKAYELVGEAVWGNGWPTTDGTPQAEKLGDDLWKVVRAYLEEHDPPSFFMIDELEQHTVSEGGAK